MMSKKPHSNLNIGNGQKGIQQCKECEEVFIGDFEDVNDKEFCSEECQKHYEAKQKPSIENSPLDGNKDVIMQSEDGNDNDNDNKEHNYL